MVAFWSVSDGGILVGFYWKQILVALKELVGQVEQNLVGLDGVDPKLVGPKEVESIQSCKEVESIQSCMEAGRSGEAGRSRILVVLELWLLWNPGRSGILVALESWSLWSWSL